MGLARFLLLVLLVLPQWPAGAAMRGDETRASAANRFLSMLEKGDYEGASGLLAGSAARQHPPQRLRTLWEGLPLRLGPLLVRRPARPGQLGGKPAMLVRLEFEGQAVEARFRFNRADRIDGFWLVPADLRLPQPLAPIDATPPEAASTFSERDFPVGDLGGTLTLPRGSGPFPAAVLVHGSGPADRDGTYGPNKPFLDLAYGLAERGVMVLRYEKRTWRRARTLTPDATAEEVQVRDAVRALHQLRALRESDDKRVFVIAHSLGGYISPRIAARDPSLAGVVLLAGLARPLYEAVPEQVRHLTGRDGLMTELETASLAEAERQRDQIRSYVMGGPTPSRPMLGIPNAYWLDHGRMRPVEEALALAKPMLLLQGERDYQVTMENDLRLWRDGLATHPDVRFITYPGLNHMFMRGEGSPGPEEYRREGRFDAGVIADISDWIGQH